MQAVEIGGLVADGAKGSLLYERGVFANRNFEELNLLQPELVRKVHQDYLDAGADIIETNSYGANRLRLARSGLAHQTAKINRVAVELVRKVVGDRAYVAGSIGPTGLPTGEVRRGEKEVRAAFAEQAYILTQEGVDVIHVETFSNVTELRIAIEATRAHSSVPIIAHVAVTDAGTVSDGTSPLDLAHEMRAWGASVVGANCNGPDLVFDLVEKMVASGIPVSAMPNAGRPRKIEDRLIYFATPENFGVYARRMFKAGVKIVGGCCGTNPEHIARIASAARMVVPKADTRPTVHIASVGDKPPARPVEERTKLGAALGQRFIFSVEVNPGTGLDAREPIEAARMLTSAGADIINIADGPRASARMSNLALAVQMQNALGIETLLHVCARDRNLLGLTSHLLGAHSLGLHNLVLITGDPPKLGDYPDATAVYDVDSIGLIHMADDFNRGLDPAGKLLGESTRFVIATGVEPAASDFDREMQRLRRKVAAGADMVMTQPVYEPKHLERFLDATADMNLQVLVGILPLSSSKNAEFLHREVPGMQIPEAIRERMRKAGKGEDARREGVTIACETLEALRERVAGAYIMPPLGKYDMAAEIIQRFAGDRHIAQPAPRLKIVG
ncbi:MAG: bifunctional homocysteine S-methyltransferase/methylenetetrahydrofolate reductase [Clostridia bacterium]|nr:bifunctional homocysteine S-methyltransferase/methylenetetrahydrofolate reductase [Deltaproteobacteria bacterium]